MSSRVHVSAARTCSGVFHDRDGELHVLGEPDLDVAPALRPDRLSREAVREHGVVPHLVQLGIRKHKRRCEQYAVRLATANVGFHALMAVVVNERNSLSVKMCLMRSPSRSAR